MVQFSSTSSLRAAGLSVTPTAAGDWDEPGQVEHLLNDIRTSQRDYANRLEQAQQDDDPYLIGRA